MSAEEIEVIQDVDVKVEDPMMKSLNILCNILTTMKKEIIQLRADMNVLRTDVNMLIENGR